MRIGHKLLAGGVLRGGALAIGAILSLFTMPIMIHSLGNRWYSLWVLAGALIAYCGLTDLGLSQAISQFFSSAFGTKDKNRMNVVFNTGLLLYSIVFLVIMILGTIIAFVSTHWLDSPEEKRVFFYMMILLGVSFGLQFPIRVIQSLFY